MKHLLSIILFFLSFTAKADTARVDSSIKIKIDSTRQTTLPYNRTLTLIPLGNATISNKSEIESELKKQYGIANGNWTVNVADALPLPTGWKDKASIDIDAGALSCYSAEMKEIIRAYNSKVGITEPKKEDYYIFVSNIPSKNTAVEGEMPRGEHYGFIFSPNPKPKTVVHELGHGAYFFEHFWDEVKGVQKGATSNIMDYTSNPTDFRVFQWDDIHERPADFISPCWKSDEAGQLFKTEYVNLKDYLIGTNTLEKISANGKLNFVTPKGEVIQLPNTVLVNFSSFVQVIGTTTSSNLSKNAIGVLTGFYIDKISWIARFEGKKFKGYINEKGDFYPFNSLEGVNKVVIGVEFNDCKLSFKQGNYKKVINDDYNLFTEIKFENESYELIGVKAVNPEKCVNCDVPMASKPQEIQTLLNELNTNPNSASIDDKIAIVNEDNLKNFVCVEDRFLLIKNIADGFIVGDDDENSIIKLIKSTPDNQAKELVNKFQQDNSGVLKRLFSVINGAELGDYIGEFSNLVQRSLGIDVCQKKQSDIDKKEKDFLESVKNQQLGCDVLDELVKRGILFLPNVIDNKLGTCNIVLETLGNGLNDKGEFSFIFYKNKTGVFNLPPTIDIKPFDWYKVYFTRKNDIKETGYVLGYGVKWLLNNYDNNQINVGINRGIIVGSIFTMGTTSSVSSVSAALWASVDLVLANGNLYIVKEEEELKKTKEGVDFINSWNKANLYVAAAQGIYLLYGVGKNIVSYKLAVSELKANYNQWRVKNLEELRKINPKLAEKLESFGTYGIKKLEEIIAEYELKVQVVSKELNISRELTEEILKTDKWNEWFKLMQDLKKSNWKNLPSNAVNSSDEIILGTGGKLPYRKTVITGLTKQQKVSLMVDNVQGMTAQQAEKLLDLLEKYKPNRITLGGSRVRGNATDVSDLEVGFDGFTQKNTYDFADNYNKTMYGSSRYTGAGAIKDKFIFTGKSTDDIKLILSPEDFFMRTGIRSLKEEIGKAGEPFGPSGFISIDLNGNVILGKP